MYDHFTWYQQNEDLLEIMSMYVRNFTNLLALLYYICGVSGLSLLIVYWLYNTQL